MSDSDSRESLGNFYEEEEVTQRTGSIKEFRNLKKIENIEDHYEVFGQIGEGGFATVSKAKDLVTGKICAIKKMIKK